MHEHVRGGVVVAGHEAAGPGLEGDPAAGAAHRGERARAADGLCARGRHADPDRRAPAEVVELPVLVTVAIVEEHVRQPVGVARHEVRRERLERDEPARRTDGRARALTAGRLSSGARDAHPAHAVGVGVVDVDVGDAVGVVGQQRHRRLEGRVARRRERGPPPAGAGVHRRLGELEARRGLPVRRQDRDRLRPGGRGRREEAQLGRPAQERRHRLGADADGRPADEVEAREDDERAAARAARARDFASR